jgi:hypothetical protein
MRGVLANETDILEESRMVLQYHSRMLNVVENLKLPTLLLSYEKILLEPASLAEAIGTFTGTAQADRLERVKALVEPSPSEYRHRDSESKRKSLSSGFAGCLDSLGPEWITGWAFSRDDPEVPVEIEFEFESGPWVHGRADEPRGDLKDAGVHPTGRCGFRIELPSEVTPVPGDYVYARDKASGREFEGSPFLYTIDQP